MTEVTMEVTVRKRVRFALEPPEVHIVPTDDSPPEDPQPRKRIWMQADDDDDADDEEDAASFPAAEADLIDPSVAAAKRSQERKVSADMQLQEDAGLLDDVAAAEEDYEEPEEAFNEVGIPIEPFHLKREREEGYFDAEGNYIQYRLDDGADDAWLESITGQPTKLDPQQLKEHLEQAQKAADGENESEMDDDDKLILKRRVLQLLQPGESVLHALRRLGGRSQGAVEGTQRRGRRQAASVRQPADSAGSKEVPPPPAPRGNGVHGQNSTVPPENREVFDRLVEYADRLLGAGEFWIYTVSREDLDQAVAKQLQQPPQAIRDPDMDMFAEDNGTAATSSATMPLPQADVMGSGMASASSGQSLAEPGTSAGVPMQPAVGLTNSNLKGSEHPVAAGADAMGSRDQGLPSAVGPSGQGASPMDMDVAGVLAPGEPQTARPSKARRRSIEMTDATLACGMSGSMLAADATGGVAVESGEGSTGEAEASAEPSTHDVLAGFVLDESSGYWYSSDLGCYYDPGTQLFGDASSGVWYKYDGAQYEVAM